MASKERSPNFPQYSLRRALEFVEKLHAEARRTPVKQLNALQAMGYNSINGRSRGVLAALRAYGLLRNQGDLVHVSELALRILHPKTESDAKAARLEAALHPKLFRSIDRESGDLSEKMLASQLFHDGFTLEGAAKAAQVFHENRAFSGGEFGGNEDSDSGDEAEFEEETTVPPLSKPENPSTGHVQTPSVPLQQQRSLSSEGMLPIPLDIGDAFIPRGMSNDDFELLLESLRLWKRKIVRSDAP